MSKKDKQPPTVVHPLKGIGQMLDADLKNFMLEYPKLVSASENRIMATLSEELEKVKHESLTKIGQMEKNIKIIMTKQFTKINDKIDNKETFVPIAAHAPKEVTKKRTKNSTSIISLLFTPFKFIAKIPQFFKEVNDYRKANP